MVARDLRVPRGKSGLHRAACQLTAGRIFGMVRWKVQQKECTGFSREAAVVKSGKPHAKQEQIVHAI